MPTSSSHDEAEKRRLRLAIARSRRRIDRHLHGSGKAVGQLASWRTYARRWPGLALAAGLALGWILAAGVRPRFIVGLLGAGFFRQISRRTTELLAQELKAFWNSTTPQQGETGTEGGNHG